MPKERIPTYNQMITMKHLMDGWELLSGTWPLTVDKQFAGKERMWWRWSNPKLVTRLNPSGFDTLEVSWPKLKRYWLSNMVKYGWLIKTATSWAVTDSGREAVKRYDAWLHK